jgi:hypothetical protein
MGKGVCDKRIIAHMHSGAQIYKNDILSSDKSFPSSWVKNCSTSATFRLEANISRLLSS